MTALQFFMTNTPFSMVQWIPAEFKHYRWIMITDHHVHAIYHHWMSGWETFVIPAGERSKTRKMKEKIEDFLCQHGCTRQTGLIAFGGGVVGDLTGFVAATYMRGIPYLQIPTTLLAMVDSSIGGKTAVNTPQAKNIIGAFWPSVGTVINPYFLHSLPKKSLINGYIELLKIFLLCDRQAYDAALQSKFEDIKQIQKAIAYKQEIVARDPLDKGLRSILNFGHSVGHAVECYSNYRIPHGYAVGYGMLLESAISYQKGILPKQDWLSIADGLSRFGIASDRFSSLDQEMLLHLMLHDKKNSAQGHHLILLPAIGEGLNLGDTPLTCVTEQEIRAGLRLLLTRRI